tara:strand:+ start:603 stop:1067 length:465 start_codon:yes stop_codon:yes gene_type:complete
MTEIEGYENYLIFEDGVIINTDTGKEKKPKSDLGYYRMGLYKDTKEKLFKLHRLIALAFIPNPENKPCVDHINRDKKDNRIENLRWVTRSENSRNKSCYSNTGLQFITKRKDLRYKFHIQRNEIKKEFVKKDLQNVIEFRNKFCAENNIQINDK